MENTANRVLVDMYDDFESAEDKCDYDDRSVLAVTNIRYSKTPPEEAEYVLVVDKKTRKIIKITAHEVHRKHLNYKDLKALEEVEERMDEYAAEGKD